MAVIGVCLTFVVFIGMSVALDAMSKKEQDIEHPGLYRNARSVTKA
ncbi:MAG: hypothetical protein NT096_14215 [Proteobacteria bacterium]|nr:hypothetical protein [Pseudomonadota bacterium]